MRQQVRESQADAERNMSPRRGKSGGVLKKKEDQIMDTVEVGRKSGVEGVMGGAEARKQSG